MIDRRAVIRQLALTAAVMALAAPSAQAAFPGKNGLIAFATGVTGGSFATPSNANSISVVNPDGTGLRAVRTWLDPVEAGGEPAWSPDGGSIAFSHIRVCLAAPCPPDRGVDITVIKADGSEERRLTSTGDTYGPTWSPDGSMIAFQSQRSIFVMDADGKDRRLIAQAAYHPAWSPDCSTLAFVSSRDHQVHALSAGGAARRLTADAGYATAPNWSPDGRKLVFGRIRNRSGEVPDPLFVVDADGTDERRLGPSGYDPAWSPDGKQIVFSNAAADLMTVNVDGSGLRPVTATGPGYYTIEPDWQPLPNALPNAALCARWRAAVPPHIERRPKLRLSVRPTEVRPRRRTSFRFLATYVAGGERRTVRDARIRFAKKVAYTNARGRATIVQRFTVANRYHPHARKRGFRAGKTTVRVVR